MDAWAATLVQMDVERGKKPGKREMRQLRQQGGRSSGHGNLRVEGKGPEGVESEGS